MNREYFNLGTNGFYGAYYRNPQESDCAVILMLGQSPDNFLTRTAVRWLHRNGCHVLALAPRKEPEGIHSFPLERFGAAITWLHRSGIRKIGVMGASITGSVALLAAAHYPEISLTLAVSPSDFVPEGFLRDGLDGAWERPADGESLVTWEGRPLPYLPYAYRHPEYGRKLKAEASLTGNLVASRDMFETSEQRHPLREEEFIPVEQIRGRLLLVGARDDCLWDTCRYIERICQRLRDRRGQCRCRAFLYPNGTHFLAPQSMVRRSLPLSADLVVLPFAEGRKHLRACRESRLDLDEKLRRELREWVLL